VKLIFMGTPAFAVPSLERLATSRHSIQAVVTNPDRPRGRGRRLAASPVKQAAQRLGLQLIQPPSLKDPALKERLAAHRPDLFVVVAFSILPGALLAIPRLGAVNLHPSLLPAYRGAAPIAWAVINGEEETGLTTFLLSSRIDEGDLLLQRQVAIDPEETAGQLEERLRAPGADLVVETINGLEDGLIEPRPQDPVAASRAPKFAREDGRIDWDRPAEVLRNFIRGTNPFPGAFTEWERGLLKVHRARVVEAEGSAPPGRVLKADARQGLVVATGRGALRLEEVQPAGRAAMEGTAFVRGHSLQAGARLGASSS
jgi:methionyl-tRNA formyltransferase